MSELVMLILVGFFRAILGTLLISNNKIRIQKGVLITVYLIKEAFKKDVETVDIESFEV